MASANPLSSIKPASQNGVKLAGGIALLWFGGLCLFVAFMSGKTAAMTSHLDQAGQPVGPLDMSDLVSRLAANAQAADGQAAAQDSSEATS